MKLSLLVGAVAASALIAGSAAHAVTFPGYGLDTGGPGFLITLSPGNVATFTATGQSQTYDGSDDTYIGVINNSGATVDSLTLTSTADIFGFDGDGISAPRFGAPGNALDSTQYGGPDGYFTNIGVTSGGLNTGVVNFIGGIANGGSDYFSLEEALDAASFSGGGGGITTGGVPEPTTWALMLIGVGGVGFAARRRSAKALAA